MAESLSDDIKMECLVEWTQGKSMREISIDHGVHYQTIIRWKKEGIPVQWEDFKEKLIREGLAQTLQELRVKAAKQVGEHWKDTERVRRLLRRVLTGLEQNLEIFSANDSDSIPLPVLDAVSDQSRKVVASMKSIQEQQMNAMGLKWMQLENLQIDDDDNQSYSDEQLAAMNPEQLLELATAQVTGENPVIDVPAICK